MNNNQHNNSFHATTICCVKKDNMIGIACDGQVTSGKNTVMKSNANKIRKIGNGTVLIGFAGSVADALTLADKLDTNLEKYNYNLMRACIEVAKLWRSDKILRNLEAMLIAANLEQMYVLSGTGDVIEPEHNVIAIGSGGNYAYAAGLAFVRSNVDKNAVEIAKESVKIAGEMCVFTNTNISSDFLVK